MPNNTQGLKIQVQGIVQGVGFRPFIFNLAQEFNLTGWVKNNSKGVEIEVHGKLELLNSFVNNISLRAPSLARISDIKVEQIKTNEYSTNEYSTFEILSSTSSEGDFVPIAPDIAVCQDCLQEFNNPQDRRYHYPFINCTNCGPRFTIIKNTPYDRPYTSMSNFKMCTLCAKEYHDPTNRRFHAQPIACPDCGPTIWLEFGDGMHRDIVNLGINQVMQVVQHNILRGKIVALKGLGGFHLTCDASNPAAVEALRHGKKRQEKPFALMMVDIETVNKHCYISESEIRLLHSPEKPIVILKKRPNSPIAGEVAPGQNTIGVMLPYTPLHYLLFTNLNDRKGIMPTEVLVMTSGNSSDEPISYTNEEAVAALKNIPDLYLMHNRPIHIRCDDSLVRTVLKEKEYCLYTIRRARGYAPLPLKLPWKSISVLGVGAELKNSICLTRNEFAVTSQYIGDLQNYQTYVAFEKTITHYERLLKITPDLVACDQHPDYLSTRYAHERTQRTGMPILHIQHHHAHIASVMAENSFPDNEPVIGLAFDGTGYGEDGNIWGGEAFIATYKSYERLFNLNYFPLPGGDLAIHYPSRTALGLLWQEKIEWLPELPCSQYYCAEDLVKIKSQLNNQINSPLTSSIGRLFDAVASLINIKQRVNYEAQAAIELETICQPDITSSYEINLSENKILIRPMLLSMIEDILTGVKPSIISAKFHNSLIQMSSNLVKKIYNDTGIRTVALSGGVWQNIILLEGVINRLQSQNYNVLVHRNFPSNDGGIALGQVSIAHHNFRNN